jgi:plastocyanin
MPDQTVESAETLANVSPGEISAKNAGSERLYVLRAQLLPSSRREPGREPHRRSRCTWGVMRRRSILALLATLAMLSLATVAIPTLVRAGGGCHGPVSPPGDGESTVIKIDGCEFFPTIARVPVGTTVRFLNTGDVPHNVTGVVGSWASDLLAPGAEFRQGFAAPGVYPFACTFHPGMNGAIVVGEPQQAAEPADLAVATQPSEATQPGADLVPLVITGLAGLGLGLGLGALAMRSRRRTTS